MCWTALLCIICISLICITLPTVFLSFELTVFLSFHLLVFPLVWCLSYNSCLCADVTSLATTVSPPPPPPGGPKEPLGYIMSPVSSWSFQCFRSCRLTLFNHPPSPQSLKLPQDLQVATPNNSFINCWYQIIAKMGIYGGDDVNSDRHARGLKKAFRQSNGLFVTMMMTAWIEMVMAGYDVFSMAVIALTLFLKMKSFVLWRLLFRAHCSTSLVPGHWTVNDKKYTVPPLASETTIIFCWSMKILIANQLK